MILGPGIREEPNNLQQIPTILWNYFPLLGKKFPLLWRSPHWIYTNQNNVSVGVCIFFIFFFLELPPHCYHSPIRFRSAVWPRSKVKADRGKKVAVEDMGNQQLLSKLIEKYVNEMIKNNIIKNHFSKPTPKLKTFTFFLQQFWRHFITKQILFLAVEKLISSYVKHLKQVSFSSEMGF